MRIEEKGKEAKIVYITTIKYLVSPLSLRNQDKLTHP
jgi:hypothetical protein